MPSVCTFKFLMCGLEQITLEDLRSVIKRSKAISSPSPLDQIYYRVFKGCRSLYPVIVGLFNNIVASGASRRQGFLKLIPTSSAREDPHLPGKFRQPIGLTPALSKLLSGISPPSRTVCSASILVHWSVSKGVNWRLDFMFNSFGDWFIRGSLWVWLSSW